MEDSALLFLGGVIRSHCRGVQEVLEHEGIQSALYPVALPRSSATALGVDWLFGWVVDWLSGGFVFGNPSQIDLKTDPQIAILGVSGGPGGVPGGPGASRSVLGGSWGRLGESRGLLGPARGHLGAILGHLQAILGYLGAILGHLGAILQLSCSP